MSARNSIEIGADIAQRIVEWVLFYGRTDMKAKELRAHITAIFGPDVDAELSRRYDRLSVSAGASHD